MNKQRDKNQGFIELPNFVFRHHVLAEKGQSGDSFSAAVSSKHLTTSHTCIMQTKLMFKDNQLVGNTMLSKKQRSCVQGRTVRVKVLIASRLPSQ